ncbi:hypothetical protein OXYTRIMIC_040 [Oxytricha trifallax]|uniref:Endonuclease/exonuclease/phosphatase domain-containing protein n=1 Tax=Oxytricha trifallax TaxID=1172189 RepID=A0A073HZF1_9SPIT|nr:hypothetical protein OXYTRIMIC_040 [Oxytricha trifallax]
MGDFNFHLKEIGNRLKQEGLQESIPEGVGTHSKGNQLDQIFSNVESIQWELEQLRLTDQKFVLVSLKIKYQDDDLRLIDKEKTVRITEVRKQCWKTFIEKGKKLSLEDQESPIRRCFQDELEKRVKVKNWYLKPPQWAIKCRGSDKNSAYMDSKEQWNEAIRDMEHCLERNDLRGFLYLVKRLKKKQEISRTNKRFNYKWRKNTTRRINQINNL